MIDQAMLSKIAPDRRMIVMWHACWKKKKIISDLHQVEDVLNSQESRFCGDVRIFEILSFEEISIESPNQSSSFDHPSGGKCIKLDK